MNKLNKIIILFSFILFTACAFQPTITQPLARSEIAYRPALSDIDKSGNLLYFLVQTENKVELKKKDLATNKEELVRIFPYNHEILKFALAADELHIAFMSKENDQFIVYISDLGGEHLIKVEEVTATNGDQQLSAENFILKRVGLKHKFLFVPPSLGCGGVILSYISHNGAYVCDKNTEIIPDEQVLIVDTTPDGKTALVTTDYENYDPKKVIELPFKSSAIENLELLNGTTVRITTAKEYVDVRFRE